MYIVNKFIYYINRNYKIIFCVVKMGIMECFVIIIKLGLNSSG